MLYSVRETQRNRSVTLEIEIDLNTMIHFQSWTKNYNEETPISDLVDMYGRDATFVQCKRTSERHVAHLKVSDKNDKEKKNKKKRKWFIK